MIQLSSGQSFVIDDKTISNFPWHEIAIVKRFTLECYKNKLPHIEMLVSIESHSSMTALLILETVTECKLPEIGHRKLQFSQMVIEDYRSHQLEDVNFRISDEDFLEPTFLFKSGEIHIS